MRRARLGCFTFTGIFAALVTAFAIVGYAVASGGQMFSPGALNAVTGNLLGNVHSHAEIAGACSSCHVAPWESQTMQDRCVVCHQDIPAQMQDLMTPHGRMYAIDPAAECRACHPEHRGETASLTEIEGWKYPHDISGYFLTAHQFKAENEPFKCADCHGSDVTTFDVQTCETCHGQRDQAFMVKHILSYGQSCLECHNGYDSMVTGFDHNAFQFKLSGKHSEVACEECHRGGHNLVDFRLLAQDCASCHVDDDPHEGMLGRDCASCHTPEGWSPSQFDHNRSAFKLTQAHVNVACRACHTDMLFKGTPSDCFSCHAQDDPHQGVLGANCASCHKATTWQDVTFDHSKTAFALVGGHVNVACTKCHSDLTFKGTPTACASCHVDVHQGQMGMDCAKCHTPFDWKDVHFDHSQTGFKLVGAHQGAACTSCHAGGRFKGTPSNCFACHSSDDKHNGQFGTDCGACHNPVSWKDVNFDHSRTGFPLSGAHSGVKCTACHSNGVYKGTPQECVACHAADDAHNGQFGTVCSACHNTSSWKNATFDHNRTGFPLVGSHSGVKCQKCHSNGVFKGTPSNCYACHAGNDKHNGQFGTDCGSCHKPTRWSDVNFNHNSTGFPLSGKHAGVQCKACHSNGYSGTPSNCYACHASDDKHNGQFGTDCASCHTPDGWGKANFNHDKTGFPLVGKHAKVDCKKCHQNGYQGTPNQCVACHKDKHNGKNGTDCAACHTPEGWGKKP
ncbi:MAG: hypothetical protein HRF47_00845 [Chloroflexota bacterium]|jgi:hypothetical protein